jgi:RimJ/RimL family protein N-acetyltransferase
LKPIGIIGLDKIEEKNAQHRNSNIFIFIEKGKQGKGYGGEAIRWVLRWAFKTRGLHRVGIAYAGWNEGAGRLNARLGFVGEGREREALFWAGMWWDKIGLGILEGEWREREERRRREGEVG